jgi:hypothetical protein
VVPKLSQVGKKQIKYSGKIFIYLKIKVKFNSTKSTDTISQLVILCLSIWCLFLFNFSTWRH